MARESKPHFTGLDLLLTFLTFGIWGLVKLNDRYYQSNADLEITGMGDSDKNESTKEDIPVSKEKEPKIITPVSDAPDKQSGEFKVTKTESFFSKFFVNSLTYGFTSLFMGIPIIAWYLIQAYPATSLPIFFIFFGLVGVGTYSELKEEQDAWAQRTKTAADVEIAAANGRAVAIERTAEDKVGKAEKDRDLWKQTLTERASGFPSLFRAIENYEELSDKRTSSYLQSKSHPAVTSAEVVRQEAKRRRDAEFAQRRTQAIIDYYENIAPFLLDFKDQIIDEKEEALREYTTEEKEDPATRYLTKEEYRKLPSVERNQAALDRFWKRPKSKWLIGRIYERYVGYLYEVEGYNVDYVGIFRGFEDLGRDLICRKDGETVVIQCKNWSQFKTIYEKHIFQFFGTVFQYRDELKDKGIKAIFYTTTEVSPLARRFAKELGIELMEKFKLNEYPSIKCNISRVADSKIYHLPFDQQYDTTKVETERGEFYCLTVKEAEEKGFRRAFRWQGAGKK